MKLTQLTPEEIEEEFEIERKRVAFLDAKLANLPPDQRSHLMTKLAQTANQACQMVIQKLVQWKIIELPKAPIQVGLYIMSSSDPIATSAYGRLCSGVAFPENGTIAILDHLALAPKEVAKNVAAHECLHILYPHRVNKGQPSMSVRDEIKWEYPENLQTEEEWIRKLDSQICGNGYSLELWESAVVTDGDNWRAAYKRLKKRFDSHHRRGHH